MADFIRSAKSSSDWTQHELIAYNITVSPIPPDEFFPTPDPSLDGINPAILNSPLGSDTAFSEAAFMYLGYLDYAIEATQEGYIYTFAIRTLDFLDFLEPLVFTIGRYPVPLTICGVDSAAEVDICLIHDRGFVLLVLIQEKEFADAEARVVAQAIATFQFNNAKRREYGLSPLDAMTVPCVKISGTRPTFYLVPVTEELSEAVIDGRYPKYTTRVSQCVTIHTTQMDTRIGMENIEYRKLALRRFLAFKELAKSHWVRILEGI